MLSMVLKHQERVKHLKRVKLKILVLLKRKLQKKVLKKALKKDQQKNHLLELEIIIFVKGVKYNLYLKVIHIS